LQHPCLLSKNNLVQKNVKKWWPVTFGTVSVLITRKNTGACYISALSSSVLLCCLVLTDWLSFLPSCMVNKVEYHVTQRLRLVVHNSVGNTTKSIRPRPRPRPVWDRSCHKTAVSDPKTAGNTVWSHMAVTPRIAPRRSSINSSTGPLTIINLTQELVPENAPNTAAFCSMQVSCTKKTCTRTDVTCSGHLCKFLETCHPSSPIVIVCYAKSQHNKTHQHIQR